MSALWTSHEAEQATGGLASAPWQASGIAIDSRSLAAGDLFIALKTPARDGHAFVGDAFAAGAAAACVHKQSAAKGAVLRVEDTYAALWALARAARARSKARLCAITGSAGKTTAKNMLAHLLEGQLSHYVAPRSYNNHWGVPLSLAALPPDDKAGIFELGMNAAGEIAELTALVRPHIAVVLNAGTAHLAGLGSQEAIAHAKAEIFSGLVEDGIAIINRDDEHYPIFRRAAEQKTKTIVSFGEHNEADVRLLVFEADADGAKLTLNQQTQTIVCQLRRRDKATALTALATLAAATALGGKASIAARQLASFAPSAGRGEEWVSPSGVRVIDESYNANPASMRAALENFAACPAKRHIAVLGDMAELGKQSVRLHAELKAPLVRAKTDLLLVCGKGMQTLYQAWPQNKRGACADDASALAQKLIQLIRPGDVVLVKGSRAQGMEVIVKTLKEHRP